MTPPVETFVVWRTVRGCVYVQHLIPRSDFRALCGVESANWWPQDGETRCPSCLRIYRETAQATDALVGASGEGGREKP